jgi:hypothetical protein
MKIAPRRPGDRGGIICMPLKENVLLPLSSDWKITTCPECGSKCWEMPLPDGYTDDMFEGKLCTKCALRKRAGNR